MKAGTVAKKVIGKKKVRKYNLEDCQKEIARLEGFGDTCSEYYHTVKERFDQLAAK
jgi:uncharacterized protein YhfF